MQNIHDMRLKKQLNLWAYQFTQGKSSWDELDAKLRAQIEKDKAEDISLIRQNEEIRLARETELQAAKDAADRERQEQDESLRQIEDEKLKQEFRHQLLSSNSFASDSDVERLFPAWRDKYLLDQTEAENTATFAKMRNQYQF